MKVPEWLKKVGDYFLTGAKAAVEAGNLIGNLVAEGAGELIEKGLEKAKDKIEANRLYRKAEAEFGDLAKKYGEAFLDGLYNDICDFQGVKAGKPSTGKAYAQFVLEGMGRIDEKTVAEFPSCKGLTEADKKKATQALMEFKQWICELLLKKMDQRDQAFVQVIAQRVVNEIGGEMERVVGEIGVSFYGKSFRPLEQCPNCGATGSLLAQDEKNLQTHCKCCGRSFYAGEQTDFATAFKKALSEETAAIRSDIEGLKRDIEKIEKGVQDISKRLDGIEATGRRFVQYALEDKERSTVKRSSWVCSECGCECAVEENYCTRCGTERPQE